MENQKDFKILNGFLLKIMAIIFMTFDHIGYFLAQYEDLYVLESVFRIIGRLSFPLIIFLLVEGVIHTRNFWRYFLRLGILALAFLAGQIFYFVTVGGNATMLSPAVDLVLTAAIVYFIKRKDYYSFFALIPFAWALTSMIVRNYEISHSTFLNWWPVFVRPSYTLYGPLLGIGFYLANDLSTLFLKSNEGTKNFIGTTYERTTKNVISAVILIILTISFTFMDKQGLHLMFSIPWQIYSLFAFIPILFYSGKRGYNAKWFQYGCYIYFPMHLVLIYLIFSLI